jgi:hypothetical protein
VPVERRRSHRYRGWTVVWFQGGKAVGESVIEALDPETVRFKLTAQAELKAGAGFEVFPPYGANWLIHSNTLSGCSNPVVLDVYGSETSVLRDNLISRGEAVGVKAAVKLAGRFTLSGNQISGFDEPDSAALFIGPDATGRLPRSVYLRNTFERCAVVVRETREGQWKESIADGNLFLNCQAAPPP